jgi:DNA-binding transcriptional LysR family regulator
MNLSLDALVLLDAIEQRGSFALAAEALGRATSSLSYAVGKLEQELDVLLFDRSGHRARLTTAGRLLLEEGRPLLVAAERLEARVRQVAHGWEPQLTLAVGGILPMTALMPLIAAFQTVAPTTRLRLRHEVLAGSWDALVSGEVDLSIGATGQGPAGGGYRVRPLGEVPFVFAVAPHHPLATEILPLSSEQIVRHRAVAIADTARFLPVRTAGVLEAQDVLTVPDLAAKLEAQCAGLGVGWLPEWAARPAIAAGRLVKKDVAVLQKTEAVLLAWRTDGQGRGLQWWLKALRDWQPF